MHRLTATLGTDCSALRGKTVLDTCTEHQPPPSSRRVLSRVTEAYCAARLSLSWCNYEYLVSCFEDLGIGVSINKKEVLVKSQLAARLMLHGITLSRSLQDQQTWVTLTFQCS